MTKPWLNSLTFAVLLLGLTLPMAAKAQYFQELGNGDLLAGFRKTGAHQGTNELVVNIGNVTNLISLPMNTTVTMSKIPAARLTDSFGNNYSFIQWSVTAANFNLSSPWSTSLGNFPQSTIWYTIPRTNNAVHTTPPSRAAASAQASAGTSIYSIGNGANTISSQLPGGTNVNNNSLLVREPITQNYSLFLLSVFMGDSQNPTIGDLGGSVFSINLEQMAPSPFTAPVRADFYEAAPAAGGRPVTSYPDPITGSTTSVYYIGYFEFSPAGVLTFTREAAGTTPPPPPPAPVGSVVGTGLGGSGTGTATISFATTNGATYTVIYTNFSGLTAPRSTWPALGNSVTGTGGTVTVTDSNPAAGGRVYSIKAQ